MASRRVRVLAVATGVAATLALGAAVVPATAAPAPVGDPVVLLVHTGAATTASHTAARDALDGLAGLHGTVRHAFPDLHLFSIAVPASAASSAAASLAAAPGITGVEQAPARRFFDAPATTTPIDGTTPDDPRYPAEQPYLAAAGFPAAWAQTHGSSAVRIAVVDTGVDVGHPDLAGKIAGTYDASTGHTTGAAVADDTGHGTFVAGVAAAATDNGVGIAGAGYDSSLLAVKISGPDGELSIDDEVAGIQWAVAHGATVINLSLGGTDPSAAEQAAINRAIARNVLVVAAAGNDGNTAAQYPADYPGVISVGATDVARHRRASFSSYGSSVAVAAPGVGIVSTTPRAASELFDAGILYDADDGTSFSAPLVSAEAALLKAVNPAATAADLRQAILASASGYAGQGLGRGQINAAAAIAHLPPTARPTSAAVAGTRDVVTFTATGTAPRISFRVDQGSWTAPVAVAAAGTATLGTATTTFDSSGYADGAHVLTARSCSAYGECARTGTTAAFRLDNVAPVLDQPVTAGSFATGLFTVHASHAGGTGGARLLVDGRLAGFAPTSPYTFRVDGSALRDGHHTLAVTSCSPDGKRCDGPTSTGTTVTTRSLHPTIRGLHPLTISPNVDQRDDTATLSFTLPATGPAAQRVEVRTLTSTGAVVRTDLLGSLGRGTHTFTWVGAAQNGHRLPDGRYTLAVVTESGALAGYAARTGTVDTTPPGLSRPRGNGVTFYPVRDGYRDTFTPTVTLSAPATLSLVIRTRSGAAVRTLTGHRDAGTVSLTWNGADTHGHRVAPGRYTWQYVATDAVGNVAATATYGVTVSGRRLITRNDYVQHYAATTITAGGTAPCATARTKGSGFPHGIVLRNSCTPASADFAYASYRFAVPRSIRVSRVAVQVYGHSTRRPSRLDAAFQRVAGGVEIPGHTTITKPGDAWHTVAGVSASGLVFPAKPGSGGSGSVYATVLLLGDHPGVNDAALKNVRLRVTYVTLSAH